MRILFLGDIIGRAGRKAVVDVLPDLRARYKIDFVIANGENTAGGFGITEKIFHELRDAGVDVLTSGNHIWDQRETLDFISRENNLLRPINFPDGTPGKGANVFTMENGANILVMNAMGRVFVQDLDCPFHAIDEQLRTCALKEGADAIFIDFHAEATSEKQAMGHFVDGRASCIVGTHTHIPTADDQILAGGTGYITDVGMCGDYNSVLGMEKNEPLQRFITKIPAGRFQPAQGEVTISGLIIDVSEKTGLANAIEPVRLGGCLKSTEPEFWVS
ncbi:MAG: TIGR00282 family metallophosphoesterase [Pseudomonadota bacterium]